MGQGWSIPGSRSGGLCTPPGHDAGTGATYGAVAHTVAAGKGQKRGIGIADYLSGASLLERWE